MSRTVQRMRCLALLAALLVALLTGIEATRPAPAMAGPSTNPAETPVQVTGQSSWTARHVATGTTGIGSFTHTCAAVASGSGALRCWGYNAFGNNGSGDTTAHTTPITVKLSTAGGANPRLSTTATRPVAAGANSCAIVDTDTATGTVQCWGPNTVGQVGDGTTTQRNSPVVVAGLSNVVAISAGSYANDGANTCAATAAGNAYCWGIGTEGQIGNGAASSVTVPTAVVATRSRTVTDGVLNGTTTITSAAAAFTSADVGTRVSGNAGIPAGATIASVTNATTAVLSQAATTSGTAQRLVVGARTVTNAGTTGGSTTLTSATGAFSASDVGLAVTGPRIPSGTTIASVTNTTTVVLSQAATGTGALTSQIVSFGPLLTGVTDIAVGGGKTASTSTTCATITGGAVRCWGDNGFGTLGTNAAAAADASSPQVVLGVGGTGTLSGASSLSVGVQTACAVVAGAGVCWGRNDAAQVGDKTTTNRFVPTAVTAPLTSGVTSISAGDLSSCAIASALAYCWGTNGSGQLGIGTTTSSTTATPTPVLEPGRTSGSTSYLTDLATGSVGAVSVGSNTACARTADGNVACWGVGTSNQLGDGNTASSSTPVWANGAGPTTWTAAGVATAGSGAVTANHTCAVSTGGTVRCWGYGGQGQMGNGTTTAANPAPVPVTLSAAAGSSPKAVADQTSGRTVGSAPSHSCAIFSSATTTRGVQCWGNNVYGQLGNNTTTASSSPVVVLAPTGSSPLSGVTALSVGGYDLNYGKTCAVKGGGVYCWGENTSGDVGDGTTTTRQRPTLAIAEGSGVIDVTSGAQHTCALFGPTAAAPNTVKCWGYNAYGQLGINSAVGGEVGSSTPVTVRDTTGAAGTSLGNVTAISAGGYHTCAISSGAAYCWGWNGYGQLGNNTTTDQYKPTATTGTNAVSSGATAVSAGYVNTCAVVSGGIRCWGYNAEGENGDGTTTQRNQPVVVLAQGEAAPNGSTAFSGMSSATHGVLSTGSYTSCAVNADGAVSCWGFEDAYGQTGHGIVIATGATSTTINCTPTSVAAGNLTTCTITVRDTGAAPTAPAGSVSLSAPAGSAWVIDPSCTLVGATASTSTCTARLVPKKGGSYTAAASYAPSDSHLDSAGTRALSVLACVGSGVALYSPDVTDLATDLVEGEQLDLYLTCPTNAHQVGGFTSPGETFSGPDSIQFLDTATDAIGSHLATWTVDTGGGGSAWTSRFYIASGPVASPTDPAILWTQDIGAIVNVAGGSSADPGAPAASYLGIDPDGIPAIDKMGIWRDPMVRLKARVDETFAAASVPEGATETVSREVYVDAIFATLAQRAPSALERERFVAQLASGTVTRVTVIEDVALGLAPAAWWMREMQRSPKAEPVVTSATPCLDAHQPFGSMAALVDQQYLDALGRTPTDAERQEELALLASCERSPEQVLTRRLASDQLAVDARLVRLYGAYFARLPDQSGFTYWSSRVATNAGLEAASAAFSRSSEFRRTYGSLTDAQFVALVYRNVLGRAPDAAGASYWTRRLGSGATSRAQLMTRFSESSEHVRTRTPTVQALRVHRAMLRRLPTAAELRGLLEVPGDGTPWTPEVAALRINASASYAARV